MHDAALLATALVLNVAGMAWLALAMEAHWEQVRGDALSQARVWRLRVLGALGLLAALVLCLWVDHASMAVLVWVMTLAGAALGIAFTLTWRPRWLRLMAIWIRRTP